MPIKKNRMFLLLTLIAVTPFFGCGNGEQPVEEPLRPVRFQQVFAGGGERVRSFSGTAQAGVESRLSFKVSGTVQSVSVQVGDRVRAGQIIAEIDPADFRLQVQHAEASLDQAQAQALQAQQSYERVKQLYENRNASRNDLDASRAASESTTAQVSAAEKQLELAKRQLGYARLTAPTAGAIATVDVEENENVQGGQTVAQLTAGSKLEVEVAMPEVLIANVREGDGVVVTFDALQGLECQGRVVEVGVSSGRLATTFPVTIRLDDVHERALPGMAAEVAFKFTSQSKRERFLAPPVAVGEDRLGRFVFIVEPSGEQEGVGVVHRRNVVIGDLTSDGIEILEGLKDGDFLITAGVSRIIDGQKVKFDGATQNDTGA